MNNREFVFHVGMAKTGTTFLQEQVFRRLSNLVFLGRPYQPPVRPAINSLRTGSSLFFNPAPVHDFVSKQPSTTVVLSDESLTDNHALQDHYAKIRGLRRIESGARILFTLRNPRSMLVSDYLHYARQSLEDPAKPFITLEAFFLKIQQRRSRGSAFSRLKYADIIEDYEFHFTRERVSVLLFEDMVELPDRFAAELSAILGVGAAKLASLLRGEPANPAVSQPALEFANRFLTRTYSSRKSLRVELHRFAEESGFGAELIEVGEDYLRHLKSIQDLSAWVSSVYGTMKPTFAKAPKAKPAVPDYILETISNETRDGNRRLLTQRDLELAKYDYPL